MKTYAGKQARNGYEDAYRSLMGEKGGNDETGKQTGEQVQWKLI